MGGVCGCFAGVDKAVGGGKEAPKKAEAPKAAEKQPLVASQPAVPEPKTLPPAPPTQLVEPARAAVQEAPKPAAEAAATDEAGELPDPNQLGIGSCLEIYSNSYTAWCPGVIYGIDQVSVLVAYQVPGEPADANISTKTLPIDSQELRMPMETGSWLTASVEVYSHSNKAWCVGKVTENVGGVLSVVFFYPNEPPDAVPVMKQLPLGDKDLRLRGIDAAFQLQTGAGHDTLQVNSAVEVFSNSLQVWCPGVVQDLKDGVLTVAFYYPDMDPSTEAPAVKEMPLGHTDLRVPGYETGAPYNTGPPVTEADLSVGGQVEVYSQSRQVWILAEVKEIADGMVTVQLRYPDMPADSDLYEKVLPVGHGDMRLATSN